MRALFRAAAVVAVAAAALFGIGAVAGLRAGPDPAPAAAPGAAPGTRAAAGTGAAAPAPDRLAATIARAQDRLRTLPRDHTTWATLGLAYVERARVTADPSLYPKAEGALRRSLEVRGRDNATALVGLGALANARHDFAAARRHATDALRINPYDAEAYGVLADAHTQLGDAGAATAAVQKMLDLRPGLAGYARASYDLEQRGRIAEATALMRRALDAAADPSDIAFCRTQLGDLAWNAGDLAGADREYAAGLAADPSYGPLLRGRARVAAAEGRLDAAIGDAATLVRRTPTTESLMEYAELLRAAGRPADADRQLALAEAAHQLFVANGGRDDLTGAALALARGRADRAVALATAEWKARPFADVADMLGRALHAAGRDAEALPYARRAVELGPRNAAYAFHLGLVSLSLGDQDGARAALTRVREINPHFSPVDGPLAARALSALEGRS